MHLALARFFSPAGKLLASRLARYGGIAMGLALCILFNASPAQAHSRLIKAQPGQGAVLATSPTQVILDFSAQVEPAFSRIELHQSNQWQRLQEIAITGKRMQAALPPLAPGKHQLRWSILSADGHHQTGTLSFTINP